MLEKAKGDKPVVSNVITDIFVTFLVQIHNETDYEMESDYIETKADNFMIFEGFYLMSTSYYVHEYSYCMKIYPIYQRISFSIQHCQTLSIIINHGKSQTITIS